MFPWIRLNDGAFAGGVGVSEVFSEEAAQTPPVGKRD